MHTMVPAVLIHVENYSIAENLARTTLFLRKRRGVRRLPLTILAYQHVLLTLLGFIRMRTTTTRSSVLSPRCVVSSKLAGSFSANVVLDLMREYLT